MLDTRCVTARSPPRQPVVLLVDDYDDALAMYRLGLTAAGFTVLTASNADQALRLVVDSPPDAVVTDVRLGTQCGIALAQRLRDVPSFMRRPIVLLTGDATVRERAPRQCYDRLLLTPCTPARLAGELLDLLVAPPPDPSA